MRTLIPRPAGSVLRIARCSYAPQRAWLSSSAVQREEDDPEKMYQRLVDSQALREDDYQRRIVAKLQHLHDKLRTYQQPPVPDPEDGLVETVKKKPGLLGSLISLLPLPEQEAGKLSLIHI